MRYMKSDNEHDLLTMKNVSHFHPGCERGKIQYNKEGKEWLAFVVVKIHYTHTHTNCTDLL